ncbi:zinc finger protein 26-like [Ochlerotatus camptorhynchus]|uniref:zinc finger protein 26-like n=1 Tax=Ochlerotatus camptorhynchus TaxID=644619 RepID=UPI0031D9C39F
MPTCVVPGCINLLQEWTTWFPRAPRLVNRWLAAIEVGTGQEVPQFQPQEAQICNMHFAVPVQKDGDEIVENADENEYREPTLFFRENVLIQIANCELCLRFDTVNDMYKLSERIVSGDNETLYSLARKYLNFPKKRPQVGQYFCESCVIQIDMTHSFWRKIDAAWKGHKKVFKMMTQEKVVFRNNGLFLNEANTVLLEIHPVTTISLDSSDEAEESNPSKVIAIDSDSDNDGMEQFEDIIVKEETQLDFSDSMEQMPVATPNDTNNSCKCYICNKSFQDRDILTEHISSSHLEKYKRACKNCNRSFSSALFYNDHMATHKPYCCNYCPLEFDERREVVFHEVQQHAGAKLHEHCGGCGKLFRSKTSLEEHMQTEHCSS